MWMWVEGRRKGKSKEKGGVCRVWGVFGEVFGGSCGGGSRGGRGKVVVRGWGGGRWDFSGKFLFILLLYVFSFFSTSSSFSFPSFNSSSSFPLSSFLQL